jgi:hypothetical protein
MVTGPGNYTLTVNLQYLLTVDADYGLQPLSINGTDWYNAGQNATLSPPAEIPIANGTRVVFSNWIGANATGRVLTLLMDGPKGVTAIYDLQYYLTVISPVGNPKGEGWYDQWKTANFSVSPSAGFVTPLRFVGWTGDSNASSANASLRMNGPKTVVALWKTDYSTLEEILAVLLTVGIVATVVVFVGIRRHREPATRRCKGLD